MSRVVAPAKRFSSTISMRPTPSKLHFYQRIQESTLPKGFLLTGLHAGVKKSPSSLDLAIILSTSPRPTSSAASFTRNAFQAAPVLVSQDVLAKSGGRARAVVVNSGCANAVTGKQGLEDAWAMVKATDALLQNSCGHETLVMSTGVIGQQLPIAKILAGIASQAIGNPLSLLDTGFNAWARAAQALITTDTFPKIRARTFTVAGRTYRMGGMDKGAGMIHPVMGPPSSALHATLLGCILTDAPVSPRSLQSALNYAVDRSFNSISVDGDMSTNDTVVALANGAGAPIGAPEIDEATDSEGYEVFKQELTALAIELAQLVVRDGEGATKFVTVSVEVRRHPRRVGSAQHERT